MRASRPALIALISTAMAVVAAPARAIDASGVLVLYNADSPEGLEIATHYQGAHPGVTLLPIEGLGTSTTISATTYLDSIRQPILDSGLLTSGIDVIVTTKGMPLKIQVETSNPGSYIDAHGVQRWVNGSSWKLESSLESELTKIDYIANETMMGDQSFNFPLGHFTSNAYYQSGSAFSFGNFSGQDVMRLTARLDGFSVADVTRAIDDAQNAYVGPANASEGPFHFVVDADPSKNYAAPMTNLVTNVLQPAGMPLTYDNTGAFVGTADGPVLGYTSHGSWQESTPDYNSDPEQGPVGSYVAHALDFTLAKGAVFNSWESFNAQSFMFGGNYGDQALLAEWLAKGGTAAVGNVAEPGASPNTVFNEDQLFGMLLGGMTFAEAAWSAARQLSWVNTVVGDPLMTWKQLLPGDANLDGVVDMGDLAAMGPYWGQSCYGGGYSWTKGDLNGDGFVDMADLALVSASWGQVSAWAAQGGNFSEPSSPMAMALLASMHEIPNIPEPSSIVLLGMGLVSLGLFGWRRRMAKRRG